MTHDNLQYQCFTWAHNNHPAIHKLLFAVPNEVKRIKGETTKAHMVRVMQMKSIGLTPGVLDLLFYWRGVLYGFDIKLPGDVLSNAQQQFIAQVHAQGGECHTISSFPQFQAIFTHILNSAK